jgi:hypothetical protein
MPRTVSFYWVLGFAAVTLGCQPDIGDSCALHSDCSQTGDRICDPTFPGGYCTMFNCEPGSCPSEAVCVAYYSAPSEKNQCSDPTDRRFERTFCMKNCVSKSDCRTEYDCIPLGSPENSVSAVVVERGSYNPRVCTLPPPAAAPAPAVAGAGPNVCTPGPFPDAGYETSSGTARDAGRGDASIRDGGVPDGAPGDARGGS